MNTLEIAARRVFDDVFNPADGAARAGNSASLFAPSFVDHSSQLGHPPTLDGLLGTLGVMHTTFSDLRFTVSRVIIDGDLVATQATWVGTHAAPFGGIAPTGRTVEVGEHRIFRVQDGLVVEHWAEQDLEGLFRQLNQPQ